MDDLEDFVSELDLYITCRKSFRKSAVCSQVNYWLILSVKSIVKEVELGSLFILPHLHPKHWFVFSLKRGPRFYLVQNAMYCLSILYP